MKQYDKQRFRELVAQDYGDAEIGRVMGVSRETVRAWRKACGFPPRRRGLRSPVYGGEAAKKKDPVAICLNCTKPECSGYCELMRAFPGT